ncbi:efflux RND transporter periplasmic adaptor subunit [uncultured Acetobacteroides sp.]|uniref:efflux RND transporter periplasmic adaptor subunit n=1 Tax=uncultured Acetobacteroides sp. TaxID=1760811 RepID=UPI0029F5483C|nr:efflux RND transporter periplasmic adaptor subunit [uncultured Acetobacteroides sp.]
MKYSYLGIAGIVAISLASCSHSKSAESSSKKAEALSDTLMSMIAIDTVRMAPIEDALKLTGEVGCDENKMAKIYPSNSGQVLHVKASLGDRVSKGQVLAVIKSADIAGGYSDLEGAKADLATAQRNLQNVEGMYHSGLSSERDYQEARNNVQKARSAVSKISSQLSINGGGAAKSGGTYAIKSPISGFIVERNISEGSFIRTDNGASLFTVAALDNVWIWANVFERDIANVGVGFSAKVRTLSYPDRIFSGKVDKASSVLDPVSKVMKVKIVIPNKDMLLKPGMYADVFVSKKESKVGLEVSASALLSENGKNFVVVIKDRSHYSIRPVTVLKTVGDACYISSGLSAGEKVITQNQLLVYNQLKEKME